MKKTTKNLKNLESLGNGLWRKKCKEGTCIYIEKEACKTCGNPYLTTRKKEGDFCSKKCINVNRKQYIDLTGRIFGRLLVLKYAYTKNARACWFCRCNCGNEITVIGADLVSKHTQSCGCYLKEKLSKIRKLNLAGKIFSRLVVLKEVGKNKHGNYIWLCKCNCGNEINVIAASLMSGNTKSCGCLHKERSSKRMYKHGMTGTKRYINAISAKRRAKKRNQTPSNADPKEIRMIYKICQDMNERAKYIVLPKRPPDSAWFHVDHIIPISKKRFTS